MSNSKFKKTKIEKPGTDEYNSRRSFLKKAGAAAVVLGGSNVLTLSANEIFGKEQLQV